MTTARKTIFCTTALLGFFLLDHLALKLDQNKTPKIRVGAFPYHHSLAPNLNHVGESWGLDTVVISTNSLGFKDSTNRKISLKSDKKRILLMGDSFTEGIGVPYEETFAGLLNARFENKFEILNAGVASYSPSIYFKKIETIFQNKTLQFDVLMVFLDLSDIQDELFYSQADNGSIFLSPEGQKYNDQVKAKTIQWLKKEAPWFLLTQHFFLLGAASRALLKHILDGYDFPWIKNLNYNISRSKWTIDPILRKQYLPGLTKSAFYLQRLGKLAKKNGVKKMFLVVYPWPDQILSNDIDSIQETFWKSWAQKNNYSFVDLFPFFVKKNASRFDQTEILRSYFVKFDFHWNRNGHQFVAEKLAEVISQLDQRIFETPATAESMQK